MNRDSDLNRPVFIVGSHKSGTTLLQRLLDGHPELFALPIEGHFFEWSGFEVQYPLRPTRRAGADLAERARLLMEQFAEHQRRIKDDEVPKSGATRGFRGYDISTVRSFMERIEVESIQDLCVAYLQALYFGVEGEPPPGHVRLVEKSVENAEFVPFLKLMFPEARFLHVIRNPYTTHASIRAHRAGSSPLSFPFIGPSVRALEHTYRTLLQNMDLTGSDYKVVRYETLVADSRGAMGEVADFLDVSWSDDLLKPTMLGEPWAGNSTTGEDFEGISASRADLDRDEITDLEVAALERIPDAIFRTFGYERLRPRRSPLLPASGEGPKTYLRNRSFLLSRD